MPFGKDTLKLLRARQKIPFRFTLNQFNIKVFEYNIQFNEKQDTKKLLTVFNLQYLNSDKKHLNPNLFPISSV